MLALEYSSLQSPKGWLIAEKLDGIRATWDGTNLISRNGNTFPAPDWFLAALPAGVALDGELYIGRGQFRATLSTVKKKMPVDSEWQRLRYHVFDAPLETGGFEARLAWAEVLLAGCPVAVVVPHRVCTGVRDLDRTFDAVCSAGGEGLMLRKPGSAYKGGRSADLLKYKPQQTDEEGLCEFSVDALTHTNTKP